MADGRRAEILAAARDILETEGASGLTMRALAGRLGIRAPSLYKHFADKEAIEVELIASGLEELAAALEAAVARGSRPLADIATAYRGWGLAHPDLYRLVNDGPLPRERLPAGVEARAAQPLVEAVGGDQAKARAAWGFAHGLISLELAGRFPPGADVEVAWRAGVDAFSRTPSGG